MRGFALLVGIFFHGAAGYIEGFLLPLAVGLPIILMLFAVFAGLGFLLSGMGLTELRRMAEQQNAPAADSTFPWVHLWFLYYLLLFYAGALIVRGIAGFADRRGRVLVAVDRLVRFCLGGIWGAAVIGLPLAAYFYALEGWPSWTGLLTPMTLPPQPPSVLAYGVPFTFGWLAHRQIDRFLALEHRCVSFIAAAVALTVASLWLGGITPRWEPYLDDRTLVWYSPAYLIAIWCWIFGLIGLAVRYLSEVSPLRRYVADASYFLYLLHLPVLAFFAAWWNPLPWHWTIKYPLQIAATLVVLFVSYRYLVRSTFIGATLNGRRYPGRLRPRHGALGAQV